jgi:thiamine transport system ATP-binding protein
MLDVEGVTVGYGATVAVDRVSLTVPDRSVLCLLGPSGCGKSTLLRAIAGLEPIRSGRVCADGADLDRVPVHRRGFGLMFQSGVLFPHLDVGGNIAYALRRPLSRRSATVDRRVAELLEVVGLPGYQRRSVTTLSGGQAQRVALARALAPAPRLLLLDEPLAALDTELRERLLEVLRSVLTETGTTALYVTHDPREAFAIADAVALMDAGRIRQSGPPAQVWAHPASEWAARFVGYSSVTGRAALRDAGVSPTAVEDADRWALRPEAFLLDPAGPISAVCTGILPGPQALRIRLRLPSVGTVDGVAGVNEKIEVGAPVRVRFVPEWSAALPPAG